MTLVDELMALGLQAELASYVRDGFLAGGENDTFAAGSTLTIAGTIDVTGTLGISGVAVTATATALNQLDGATFGNSVASKAAILDSNKCLRTNSNNGTAGTNCTVIHYGDGHSITAIITITNAVITVGNSANLATGTLIYTLPAGTCLVEGAYMSVAIAGVSTTTDTPDVGIGTVVGTGAVTTLDGTPTFENIITGQTAADTNGTATVKAAGPTAGVPLEITTGGAHTVYLNAAAGWGANADVTGTLNGTVVLKYILLAA